MAEMSKRSQAKTHQSKIVRPTSDGRVVRMNEYKAHKVIARKVVSTVARRESLERLIDPIVQAGMLANFPAIGKWLPSDARTVYNEHVPKLDQDTFKEMVDIFKMIPGLLNVGFDGATFNRKSKVR